MREVLTELMRWWRAGETVGVGTVVGTWRSAPRQPGASMLVGPGRRGGRLGLAAAASRAPSTSSAQEVVESGTPVLQRYGVSDDDAYRRGPDLRGHPRRLRREGLAARPSPSSARSPPTSRPAGRSRSPRSSSTRTRRGSGAGSSCAPRATRSDRSGDRRAAPAGSLGSRAPTTPVTRRRPRACSRTVAPRRSPTVPTASGAARGCGSSSRRTRPSRGCSSSARSTSRRRSRGSAASSATTSRCATRGRCSRRRLALPGRRRGGRRVAAPLPRRPRSRPGGSTRAPSSCVLTHDPKFDVPLLEVALRLPEVAYIGAMGSRRTHDDRLERLREAGLTDAELDAAVARRSGSTSARAPRRRPPCRSPPRSSRCGGAGGGRRLQETGGAIHHHQPRRRRFPDGKGRSACGFLRIVVEPLVARVTSGEDHEHVTVLTAEGVKDDSGQRHRRRSHVLRRHRTPHAARPVPARHGREGGDRHRLRHEQLRRLHRAPRRAQREVVQRPGRAGRRARGHHDRGHRHRRRAAPDAAGLPRQPRPAVRLLHARA